MSDGDDIGRVDRELSAIAGSDQLDAAIKGVAHTATLFFDELRRGSMSRSEAFKLTQTWLATANARPRTKDGGTG